MDSHRGQDLVALVEELPADAADALHDRFHDGKFDGDVVELGFALTEDLVDGVDLLSGRDVVGVAVL